MSYSYSKDEHERERKRQMWNERENQADNLNEKKA